MIVPRRSNGRGWVAASRPLKGRGGRPRSTPPCTGRGQARSGDGRDRAPRERMRGAEAAGARRASEGSGERDPEGSCADDGARPNLAARARRRACGASARGTGGSGEPAAQGRGGPLRLQPAAPIRLRARWALKRPPGRGASRRPRLPARSLRRKLHGGRRGGSSLRRKLHGGRRPAPRANPSAGKVRDESRREGLG